MQASRLLCLFLRRRRLVGAGIEEALLIVRQHHHGPVVTLHGQPFIYDSVGRLIASVEHAPRSEDSVMHESRDILLELEECLPESEICLGCKPFTPLHDVIWQRYHLHLMDVLLHVVKGVEGILLAVCPLLGAGELHHVLEDVRAEPYMSRFRWRASLSDVGGESTIKHSLDRCVVLLDRTVGVEVQGCRAPHVQAYEHAALQSTRHSGMVGNKNHMPVRVTLHEGCQIVGRHFDSLLSSQDGVTKEVGIHYLQEREVVSSNRHGSIEGEQPDQGIVQPEPVQHVEDVGMPQEEDIPWGYMDEAQLFPVRHLSHHNQVRRVVLFNAAVLGIQTYMMKTVHINARDVEHRWTHHSYTCHVHLTPVSLERSAILSPENWISSILSLL